MSKRVSFITTSLFNDTLDGLNLLDWLCVLSIFLILLLMLAVQVNAAGITICSEHGVRSGATGNKQTTFVNGKRRESCEYTHPLKDLSGSHKFWSECE